MIFLLLPILNFVRFSPILFQNIDLLEFVKKLL